MELIYPWVLYIGAAVLVILSIFRLGRKSLFKKGRKVANAELIEETKLYKRLVRRYRIISGFSIASLMLAIACAFVLLSRPAKVDTINTELRNRDIFLCLDASGSVAELNIEICDKLKTVVRQLDGERFGISIFNGRSVLVVPLTNDYNYVLDTLDNLRKGFVEMLELMNDEEGAFSDDFDMVAFNYISEGTLCDDGRSSLVGDGLASCLYNFPDLTTNTERKRLIIFTTDNDINGEQYVTLDEASKLCKKNDVKVFSIAPDNVVDEEEFKKNTELTGGKYYRASNEDAYSDLVIDIEETDASVIKKFETVVNDKPVVIFVIMMTFMGIHLVLNRLVKN